MSYFQFNAKHLNIYKLSNTEILSIRHTYYKHFKIEKEINQLYFYFRLYASSNFNLQFLIYSLVTSLVNYVNINNDSLNIYTLKVNIYSSL